MLQSTLRAGTLARHRWAGCLAQAGCRSYSAATASTYPVPIPPNPVASIESDPQLDDAGYPRLPNVSRQWRNPYTKWDDPQERYNLNEPVHAEEDMMGMWAPDVHKYTVNTALKGLTCALVTLVGFAAFVQAVTPDAPMAKRTFPYNGLIEEFGGVAAPTEDSEED